MSNGIIFKGVSWIIVVDGDRTVGLIRGGFGVGFGRRSTSRLSAVKPANDRKGAISIFGAESMDELWFEVRVLGTVDDLGVRLEDQVHRGGEMLTNLISLV